jgi:hypothetical protein
MRPVKEITAAEENFRTEPVPGAAFDVIKRDPVKPELEGTIILVPFRITGYDPDCDGSLMARLEAIDKDGEATGYTTNCHGLYPSTDLVVTPEELKALFGANDRTKPRR